jgi:hypothetical protein
MFRIGVVPSSRRSCGLISILLHYAPLFNTCYNLGRVAAKVPPVFKDMRRRLANDQSAEIRETKYLVEWKDEEIRSTAVITEVQRTGWDECCYVEESVIMSSHGRTKYESGLTSGPEVFRRPCSTEPARQTIMASGSHCRSVFSEQPNTEQARVALVVKVIIKASLV